MIKSSFMSVSAGHGGITASVEGVMGIRTKIGYTCNQYIICEEQALATEIGEGKIFATSY